MNKTLMSEKEPSSSVVEPSTVKLGRLILLLTVLIKIGKYLPWLVLAFVIVNMTFVMVYFTWWSNMLLGVLNAILAAAGFLFFAQLVRRRTRYRYKS
jgi:hypothetical protein